MLLNDSLSWFWTGNKLMKHSMLRLAVFTGCFPNPVLEDNGRNLPSLMKGKWGRERDFHSERSVNQISGVNAAPVLTTIKRVEASQSTSEIIKQKQRNK